MSVPSRIDRDAREVTQICGVPPTATYQRVSGGFSDATVWRVDCPPASFALKAYPKNSIDAEGLRPIHQLLQKGREAGLICLPRVFRICEESTLLAYDGMFWDLVSWQPGTAVLATEPTSARLVAAGATLARLHEAWRRPDVPFMPCPAISRRLVALEAWNGLRSVAGPPPMADIVAALNRIADRADIRLLASSRQKMPLQPCMGDIWHAHLLFSGDEVTGLIDHAAVKWDHPTADLARLLGSLDLNIQQSIDFFGGYEQIRPMTAGDWELLQLLEPTGIIGGLVYWLRKLTADELTITPAIDERIQFLLRKAAAIEL